MIVRTDVIVSNGIYGARAIGGALLVSKTNYLWLLCFSGRCLVSSLCCRHASNGHIDLVDTWRGYLLDHEMAPRFVAGPSFVLLLLTGVLWWRAIALYFPG